MVDLASSERRLHTPPSTGLTTSGVPAPQVNVVCDRRAAIDMIARIPEASLTTGYQHPVFLRSWLENADCQPFFVTLRAAGHRDVLLPLERLANNVAGFIGGRHANGNFPVGDAPSIEALGDQALTAMANHSAIRASGIDALVLERQHPVWKGIANPFVTEDSSQSPNVALSLSLEGGFDEVLSRCSGSRKKKKFRNQMRKLEAIGEVATVIPVQADETQTALARFFALKADRFQQAGIANVFADDATQNAFIKMFRDGAERSPMSHEVHVLRVGDETAAIMGCTTHDGRITVEFSTFDPSFGHAGPGDLLFFLAIRDAAERGFEVFDFGVGDEPFKRSWCDIETWHQDTVVPISIAGQIKGQIKAVRTTLVRGLKSNKTLWSAAKATRKQLAGMRGPKS